MRSLPYRLFKVPYNADDCIDLITHHHLETITVRLKTRELIHEECFVTQMILELKVLSHHRTCQIDQICGGFVLSESNERKRKAVEKANNRRQGIIERLLKEEVRVNGPIEQFHYNSQGIMEKDKEQIRKNPYQQFLNTSLILRDQLAIDRTVLANERTLLAYFRTGFTLALTGLGIYKFFESPTTLISGGVLIVLGGLVSIFGWIRFVKMDKKVQIVRNPTINIDGGAPSLEKRDLNGAEPLNLIGNG